VQVPSWAIEGKVVWCQWGKDQWWPGVVQTEAEVLKGVGEDLFKHSQDQLWVRDFSDATFNPTTLPKLNPFSKGDEDHESCLKKSKSIKGKRGDQVEESIRQASSPASDPAIATTTPSMPQLRRFSSFTDRFSD